MHLHLLLSALFLPFLLVSANADDEHLFPHQNSDIPADPSVTWGALDNGLRYAIMPNNEPPDRVSMRLRVGAGSLHEEEDQRGLAHFLEHMAFNGTENFPPEELITFLQSVGIAFGAHLNAYTSFDETVYMLDLPNNEEELVDTCLLVLRDWADRMLLVEEEIDKERGVILSEKRDRDSVEMRLMEEQFNALLPDARVSQRFPIGDEEVIKTADRETFLRFYEDNYTADRMTVIVVGAVDTDEMIAKIDSIFGSVEPAEEKPEPVDPGPVSELGQLYLNFQDDDAPRTEVSIGALRAAAPEKDTFAHRTKELPERLANQMLNRRLEILANMEDAPFISGSASSGDFLRFADLASLTLRLSGDNWQDALTVAEQELRRALEHGFTEAEFAEATARLRQRYQQNVRTKDSRHSNTLAMSIVRSIRDSNVFTDPETEMEWLEQALEPLTPEDCHQALVAAWHAPTNAISVSGPHTISEEEIRKAAEASRAQKVEPHMDTEAEEFAYTEFGPQGSIENRETLDDLDIHQWQLANGIRLNLKATDFQRDTIHILVRFGGGKLTQPADKPGLDIYANTIINEGGLEAHSQDTIQSLFAGKNVASQFAVDNDAFTWSGRTNRDDFADQLRLLTAYLSAPGFRPEAERRFDRQLPVIATQALNTPEGVFSTVGQRFLYGGDRRFGILDMMKLEPYSADDVREWVLPQLFESPMEISIVGDFEIDEITGSILATFGALPERPTEGPDYSEQRHVPQPEPGTVETTVFESSIPKALTVILWQTADMDDIHQSRRLNILASILRDRMRVRIREELGDAYSPFARSDSSDTWKDFGYIMALSSGEPESAERVAKEIRAVSNDLAENGASEDEFNRAIRPLLASLEEQLRDNSYWLRTVLAKSQSEPRRIDWARSMVDDYESITAEEVSALAKEFLGDQQAIQLIITTPPVDEAEAEEPDPDQEPVEDPIEEPGAELDEAA